MSGPNNMSGGQLTGIKPFRGIRPKLIFTFCLLFTVFFFAIELVNIFGLPFVGLTGRWEYQKKEAFGHLSLIADLKKQHLQDWLLEQMARVRVLSANELLVNETVRLRAAMGKPALADMTARQFQAKVWPEESYRRLMDNLRTVQEAYQIHNYIDLSEAPSGRILASTVTEHVGGNASSQTSFQRAFLTRHSNIGATNTRGSSLGPALNISHVVTDSDGEVIAVVIAEINPEVVIKPILQAGNRLGEHGEAVLVNQDFMILTSLRHPLPDGSTAVPLSYKNTALPAQLAASGEEGMVEALDYRGVPVLAAYRHLRISSDQGWGLVFKKDQAEIFAPLEKDLLNTMFMALIGISVLIVCTVVLAASLTRPIKALSLTAAQVAQGDLSARSPIMSQDEVGLMARTFNAMIGRLQLWGEELENLVKSRTADLDEKNRLLIEEIKERQAKEVALRLSEERFRRAAECSSDIIYELDMSNGHVQYFGDVDRAQGYEPGEFPRTRDGWLANVHPEDKPGIFEELRLSRQEKRPHKLSFRLRKKDGTFLHWIDRGVFVFDEDGNIIKTIGACTDVTERKREKAERRKLEEHLRHSQKMEAIGTLAGGIAHDFNNILAAIIGYVELSQLDLPPAHPISGNLDQVLKAGLRAKSLVQQILSFSRRGEQERKPLRLTPMVKECLNLLRASLPTTIEIRLTSEEADSATVLADPIQMHQLIMNVGTNAGQAMKEHGGLLTVNLKIMDLDRLSVADIDELPPGRYLRLSISDSGHGMPPAVLERIFDPFFTTKGPGEGTGMGLAVVYGIVKSLNGGLKVYSEVGKGSVFHIYLPLVAAQAEDRPDSVPSPVAKGTERILMVDDEPDLVTIGVNMLKNLGYQVASHTSSLEALKAFQADPRGFDVLITDQTMPKMTGVELAREILIIRPDFPIILCTGFSQQVSAETARSMGITRFLMKPIVLKDVAEAVRAVLDENKGQKST